MSSVIEDVNIDPFLDFKGLLVFLKPSKRKKIRKVRVVLKGTLGINSASEFIERIKGVFESYDFVDFYMEEVDNLDLPFIQALYHIKEFYGTNEKIVTVDSKLNEDMKKIIIRSGFEYLIIKPKNV